MRVRRALALDEVPLARMRAALWPESSIEEHRAELREILRGRVLGALPLIVLVAEEDRLVGFAEVGLRSHADGCDPSRPVGFLEGWYVRPEIRGQGVGKMLIRASEEWAREQGCSEMASDTWAGNLDSVAVHQSIGFVIVDRCVHFRKPLI